MFRSLIIFSIMFLLGSPYAKATEQIYTEESIFDNVSIISAANVKNLIADSIIDELQSDRIELKLRNHKKGVQLSVKKEFFDVEIVDFEVNKRTRRFDYKVSFSSDGFNQVLDIKGSYDEIVSIPTLAVRVPYGTVVNEEDIEFVDIAAHKLRHDTITDPADLIGKALKHSKSSLRPIRKRDVQMEQVIKRTDNIDIVYETPSITLTAKGVAMESGAKGDLIKVRNTSSNKIVEATIHDSSMVVVRSSKL